MSLVHRGPQRRRPRAVAWPALARLAALALALGGCADSPTQARDDQARLTVSATVAGTPIAAIVVTITAADIAPPLVFDLTIHDGLATGTLHVPPGLARTFTAQAFDSTGAVTHQGAATADIQLGDNGTLSIVMLPHTGQFPVTVTIGPVSVLVSPASAALTVGGTRQFAAAITYEGGEAVPGAIAVWGSTNPVVASVDRFGLVTAHAAGEAQIVAVFAGSGGASAVTVSAAPEPSTAKIAFESDRDGNWEICVMNADGTGQTRLTNNTTDDGMPAWSPDRTRIAFESSRDGNAEIYVMNADGTGQTRLTNSPYDDGEPAWSPDGTRIAFSSYRDFNHDIYVMNADGTGVTQLTNNPADDRHPTWSPDGTRLAFHSERDGNAEIYVMNADGTGLVRLTNSPYMEMHPSWSPDGARIAFESNRDNTRPYPDIYVMNADGSGQTRLTDWWGRDERPTWSPNGTQLAFASDRDGNIEIYVINANGTGLTRLTTNSAYDFWPAWR